MRRLLAPVLLGLFAIGCSGTVGTTGPGDGTNGPPASPGGSDPSSPAPGTPSGPSTPSMNPDGTPNPDPGMPAIPSGKLLVGYLQSWSQAWKATGAETEIAKLPSYLNVVNLTFMRPDCSYTAGSHSLAGTGLDFSYDGPTLLAAVTALKAANPGTKVLVSVGGATYATWTGYNPTAVAAFVKDFGLDGIDVDYEPTNPACAASNGHVTCASDGEFVQVVSATRAAMPRPQLVSIAAWSVGAYGEGAYAAAAPTGSAYTGLVLALLRSTAAQGLDLVNVMSYDASPAYDPIQALAAYQTYWKGAIAMGVEVPPEAWGGHVTNVTEVDALADAVVSKQAAGMMLWSLEKKPNGAVSPTNPDAQTLASAICTKLAMGNCAAPLLP
jgi:chitinase